MGIDTKRTRKPETKPALFCIKPPNVSNTFEGGVLVLAGMEVRVLWLGPFFLSLLGLCFEFVLKTALIKHEWFIVHACQDLSCFSPWPTSKESGGAEAAGGRRKLGMCGMMAFVFPVLCFRALDAGKM